MTGIQLLTTKKTLMKNAVKILTVCLIAAFTFAIVLSGSMPGQQNQVQDPFKSSLDVSPKIKELPYHQGMITIKLKEGVGAYTKQTGTVNFNIPSLDQLATKFEIKLLEKRFQYNPAKLRSDLPDLSRIYRIGFPDKFSVNNVINSFSKNSNIEYAEPIPVIKPAEEPNDSLYSLQQHLPQIMAPEAWDIHHGEDGEEVIIAIVDDGVYWTHPDLTENIWQNLGEDFDGDGHTLEFNGTAWVMDPDDINSIDDDGNGKTDDLIGWDMAGNNNNPSPGGTDTHGTHCAGIAAGVTNNETGIASVCWNVKIMGVQINFSSSNPYDGIIYAAQNNADIISNSWGGPGYSEANKEVIEYASGLGSIVVVAAHNYDNEIFIYPASYPHAVSVASVAVTDAKASYSNYGVAIDVSAPGGDAAVDGGILSTVVGGYDNFNGTSMATPMVAGLMALVKSYNPGWNNMEIIAQVMGTADDIDDLNPDYEYKLGSGRINAFKALDETGITFPQELKIGLVDYSFFDENNNEIIEAGEIVDFDFKFQNFTMYECSESFNFNLVSEDPEITVVAGSYSTTIPIDDYFEINGVFQVQISEDATSHLGDLKILIDGTIPVVLGGEIPINPIIAPEGLFVYDGNDLQTDLSGWFVRDVAIELGIPTIYSTIPPKGSLNGFDAVFLSFGNYGSNYIPFESSMATVVYNYLLTGGSLYIEGGDALGFDQSGNDSLHTCMGLLSVLDGAAGEKPITNLEGQEDNLTEGMLFTGSTQSSNIYIDIFNPINDEDIAFIESTVGNVGIQYEGLYGQKAFCFSYALAALADHNELNNRSRLLTNIFEFFEVPMEEGYLSGEFGSDTLYGLPPLDVQFFDWSISDPDSPINSWQWDFDNDGVIDSDEENPIWAYNESGNFTVKLIVSNGMQTDTVIKENYIDTKAVPFGTWHFTESPYMINHEMIVPDGQTLIIEPGVEVIFTGHYRFKVFGQLLAEGTESDSIYFTAQDTETGWHSLRLQADPLTNDTCKLSYCVIEYGKGTLGLESYDNIGGGLLIWEANATVAHSTIRNNLVSGTSTYGAVGGGVMIVYSNALVQNCNIIHNEAESGAGMGLIWGNPTIKNCLIANNMMSLNSPYWRESGGIVIYQSNSLIINSTIVNNIGGGMVTDNNADPILINTISWGNNDGNSHNFFIGNIMDSPEITYCDFQGGYEAIGGDGSGDNFSGIYENNMDDDPLFIDPENENFHLTENSPCIDAGDPEQPLDPDGTISDIGAFYYDQTTGVFERGFAINNLKVIPNPVISSTTLHYVLKSNMNVELKIFNLKGQQVFTLLNEYQLKGEQTIVLNGSELPAGVYFCVLKTPQTVETKKIIKLN